MKCFAHIFFMNVMLGVSLLLRGEKRKLMYVREHVANIQVDVC